MAQPSGVPLKSASVTFQWWAKWQDRVDHFTVAVKSRPVERRSVVLAPRIHGQARLQHGAHHARLVVARSVRHLTLIAG
jgi:hypothetical protein